MKRKEFLKPDWKKLSLFVIIFFVVTFFLYLNAINQPVHICNCPMITGEQESANRLSSLLGIFYFGSNNECLCFGLTSSMMFSSTINLLVIIFLSYFLSSLVVWIYQKLRKKK